MTYDPVMATLQQAEAVAAQVQPQPQPHMQPVGVVQNPVDYVAPVQTHVQPQAEVFYQQVPQTAAPQPQYIEQPVQYVQPQPQVAPQQYVQPQPVAEPVQYVQPQPQVAPQQYVQPQPQTVPQQYAAAPAAHNAVAVAPAGGPVGFGLSREALTAAPSSSFNNAEWFLKAGKGTGTFTIRPRNAESQLAAKLSMRVFNQAHFTLDFENSFLGEALSVTNQTYAFSADGINLMGYVDGTIERFKNNWPALVQFVLSQGRNAPYLCLKGMLTLTKPIVDIGGTVIEEIPVGTVVSFDTTKTTWSSLQAIISTGLNNQTLAFNTESMVPNQLKGKVDVIVRAQAKVSKKEGTGYTAVDFLPDESAPAEAAKAAKGRKPTA